MQGLTPSQKPGARRPTAEPSLCIWAFCTGQAAPKGLLGLAGWSRPPAPEG